MQYPLQIICQIVCPSQEGMNLYVYDGKTAVSIVYPSQEGMNLIILTIRVKSCSLPFARRDESNYAKVKKFYDRVCPSQEGMNRAKRLTSTKKRVSALRKKG